MVILGLSGLNYVDIFGMMNKLFNTCEIMKYVARNVALTFVSVVLYGVAIVGTVSLMLSLMNLAQGSKPFLWSVYIFTGLLFVLFTLAFVVVNTRWAKKRSIY